jgi:hypothetical protein
MYNKLIASTSSYPEEYQDIIIIEPIIFTIAQRWFKIKNVQQADSCQSIHTWNTEILLLLLLLLKW